MNTMIFKELDTPSFVVDIDILQKNIVEMQDLVKGTGKNLRPHTKTHKCPEIAKMQLKEGACGITVAKLGEAEVMIENGITDIHIAYPVFGKAKKERLINVLKKAKIIISLDSYDVALFLSDLGLKMRITISILLEVNTGLNRCGVEPNTQSIKLAKHIYDLPGIKFKGLMNYPGLAYSVEGKKVIKKKAIEQYDKLMGFKKKLESAGITSEEISTGSTATVEFERHLADITEFRPGGYIFNDRNQLAIGRVGEERCAASVLATVISVPVPERAIIDTGSKSLCSDGILGDYSKGFGLIKGRHDLTIAKLNEEHGIIKSRNNAVNLKIGDRLEVIPNHICVVANNFEKMYIKKGSNIIDEFPIAGRGKLQ
jgi:D-serine deaminase-like pyridoxal phosphate-dependent protein